MSWRTSKNNLAIRKPISVDNIITSLIEYTANPRRRKIVKVKKILTENLLVIRSP